MTSSTPEENTPGLIYFIIIILPFLHFYWMIPFVSNLTIGNDYPLYSVQWQMELLFSIKTGSFPLYAPGFAFGHSSSAMTLAQIYHPLAYISSHLPGYWSGKALQLNTLLRLLSLGLAQMALFALLRRIRISTLFAFLLSCVTVYNLRMLDMFRFGASLETYTGFLFLFTACCRYFLKPTKVLGPLSITGATYWLICSGHPPMMYYGILGAGLFLLLIPLFLSEITGKKFIFKDSLTFWFKSAFYMFLGLLLSSAYILPYYFDFIRWNVSRVATGYNYSLSLETFYGNISNFFMPLLSDVHNAFGGSYLFLIAALLPVLRCFKIRIPRSVWIVWGVTLLVYLYTEGARTPIHRWVWEYLPFASSVRPEGRISIITPVLMMMLLTWIVQTNSLTFRLKKSPVSLNSYVLLASVSLLLIVLYSLVSVLLKPEISIFSCKYIRSIPVTTIMAVTFVGMSSLVVLILYGILPGAKKLLGILLCLVILVHIGWILRYGTFVTERHDQPTFDQMRTEKKESLNFRHHPGEGLFSSVITNQMDHSFVEPFLGKIYTYAIPVSSQEDAYDRMARNRLPQQILIENFDPEQARLITDKAFNMHKGSVNLIYSSFNRLQFRVISETPAFFGLSYPYTGYWKARINGNSVPIYCANGASQAVEIPGGESVIEFRYWSPAVFWGIVASCATFVLTGFYFCVISLTGIPRITAAVLLLIIGAGFFIIWNQSIYTGDNLDTQYTWTYTPPKSNPDIAYGKKTSSLPVPKGIFYDWYLKGGIYINHSSRVVDGNRRRGSGFKIPPKDTTDVYIDLDRNVIHLNKDNGSDFKLPSEDIPSVTVDLDKIETINSVIIYASTMVKSEINCNFEVLTSPDRKIWKSVAFVTPDLKHDDPVKIALDSPQTARYVKIKVSGSRKVILDEVEIYR